MDEPLFERVRERVRAILENAPGCHDFDHTLRVLRNSMLILEKTGHDAFEAEAVRLAALLHDAARPEELESNGAICHAKAGGPKAAAILRESGCADEKLIKAVSDAVLRHRFRGTEKPVTTTDMIVYDADKLDSLGAVGIGRSFHFAGRIGAKLHNTDEEALSSAAYGPGDTAYREYLVKLRYVPGRMLTEAGRAMALGRAEFMREFFVRMNDME